MGQGKSYTRSTTFYERKIIETCHLVTLHIRPFSQGDLPDRKQDAEITLLKVTKIYISGTFSSGERLHTKLFPDWKETTEIATLGYSKVNDNSWLYNIYHAHNSGL